jgi:hypothetical protein
MGEDQKYAAQTFTKIDQFKWERIRDAVEHQTGIVMANTTGAGTAKGITISWVYSTDTQTLIVDLVKRSWYDPSEGEIDQRLAEWIAAA